MDGEAGQFRLPVRGSTLGRAADATRSNSKGHDSFAGVPLADRLERLPPGELASSQLTFSFIKLKVRLKQFPHILVQRMWGNCFSFVEMPDPSPAFPGLREDSFVGSSQTAEESSLELPAGPERCWPLASK